MVMASLYPVMTLVVDEDDWAQMLARVRRAEAVLLPDSEWADELTDLLQLKIEALLLSVTTKLRLFLRTCDFLVELKSKRSAGQILRHIARAERMQTMQTIFENCDIHFTLADLQKKIDAAPPATRAPQEGIAKGTTVREIYEAHKLELLRRIKEAEDLLSPDARVDSTTELKALVFMPRHGIGQQIYHSHCEALLEAYGHAAYHEKGGELERARRRQFMSERWAALQFCAAYEPGFDMVSLERCLTEYRKVRRPFISAPVAIADSPWPPIAATSIAHVEV